MLHFSLTGTSPFLASTKQQTMANVLKAQVNFDPQLWRIISEEARDWIQKLILKDKRYLHMYMNRL